MAARRKKDDGASEMARGFAVIVEEMRGHFGVFGEALASLDGKVTRLDDRLTRLEDKVTKLDDRVTAGFGAMELRFERVDHQIGLLQVAVLETREELKKKVDRDEVEAIVEGVVTRMVGR